ncbi:MAG: TolC family protein, partial [Terriglobales bacterium]
MKTVRILLFFMVVVLAISVSAVVPCFAEEAAAPSTAASAAKKPASTASEGVGKNPTLSGPFDSAQGRLPQARQGWGNQAVATMSLEQVLDTALNHNPEIRTAMRRVNVSEAKVPGAGALDDPMAMYKNWGTPLSKPWDANQAQNMFMVQQMFPGFGKRAARTEVATKETGVAKLEVEAMRREIAVRVRKAFLDLLRSSDEQRIQKRQVSLTREALSSAQVKYTVGKAPQQDVLKAQIALTKLAQQRIALDQDAAMARAELNTLMGRSPDTPLEIAGEYTTPANLPGLMDLEKTALENRPELLAVKKEAEIADSKTGLAKLGYKPDFTVAAGYMLMP